VHPFSNDHVHAQVTKPKPLLIVRSLQNYKTYANLSVLLNLMTLRTRKILSLDILLS
jgi:hypothetical protein